MARAWGIANHPSFAETYRKIFRSRIQIKTAILFPQDFPELPKFTMRAISLLQRDPAKGKQMMDLREATKTLNAYSTLLASKIRLRDRMSNLEAPEAKDVIEELIATLKVETRQAMVLSILVSEEIAKHAEQIVIGFTDELPELIEAINRIEVATAEARKATLAHEEKSRTKEPKESPSAKGIREFLARQGRPPN